MNLNVVEFNKKKVFTLEEIQNLLPIIHKITKKYSDKVQILIRRLESLQGHNEDVVIALESKVNSYILEWQSKVEKLGGATKGLWIADFDSGDGYYCWKFPEEKILFWHGYSEGYCGRIRIEKDLDDVHFVAEQGPSM
jgi:hypothetical protein